MEKSVRTENRPLNHRPFIGTIGKSREPKNPSIPTQVNNNDQQQHGTSVQWFHLEIRMEL
jgi:hypothetical protein